MVQLLRSGECNFFIFETEIDNRVKWGKMGHFFNYFLNISKSFTKMKYFMNDYAQCVFSLLLQKRKLPLRNERGGQPTPFQKRVGDPFYPI